MCEVQCIVYKKKNNKQGWGVEQESSKQLQWTNSVEAANLFSTWNTQGTRKKHLLGWNTLHDLGFPTRFLHCASALIRRSVPCGAGTMHLIGCYCSAEGVVTSETFQNNHKQVQGHISRQLHLQTVTNIHVMLSSVTDLTSAPKVKGFICRYLPLPSS